MVIVDRNFILITRLKGCRTTHWRVKFGTTSVHYTLFYKNHVFQNEAGLFFIFCQNRGSIVLNLFLNLTKSFRKNEKKTRVDHNNILFIKAIDLLFGTESEVWCNEIA